MDDVVECEYCSCDLHKGMNWWFEIQICDNCHNEQLADEDYQARLKKLGD